MWTEDLNAFQNYELSRTNPMYEFKAQHCILEFRHLPQGVTSRTVPEHFIATNDNSCAGLPCSLKLAVGAQVMLRRNIMCEYGLVNGVCGVIVGFNWSTECQYQHQGHFQLQYL